MWDKKVPFDKDDNLIKCVRRHSWSPVQQNITWKDNFEVSDFFEVADYFVGSRYAKIILSDTCGKHYSISLKDFMQAIPRILDGAFYGTLTYKKHGSQFCCTLVDVE